MTIEQTFEEARFLSSDLTAKEALYQLVDLSLNLKKKGHDLFVSVSPHVQCVECRLYIGGWNLHGESHNFATIYYDRDFKEQFDQMIKRIEEFTC